MNVANLCLTSRQYQEIRRHLLPSTSLPCEEAVFLFCDVQQENEVLSFTQKDSWLLPPESFASRSEFYLELTDQTRASIIKHAHDLGTNVVELHSHPRQPQAEFSWNDISGFAEFVPHIRWRLKGKPYGAIVCTDSSFDSLVWVDADEPAGNCSIVVDGESHKPTGITLRSQWMKHERPTF